MEKILPVPGAQEEISFLSRLCRPWRKYLAGPFQLHAGIRICLQIYNPAGRTEKAVPGKNCFRIKSHEKTGYMQIVARDH